MPTASQYYPFLCSCSWFRQLDAEIQRALLGAAELRDYARHERVLRSGEACDGLSVIVEGSVRVTQKVNGKDALLGIFAAPFWMGDIAIIDGDGWQHDVFADQPLRLLHVPMADIKALLARRPDFYRHLGLLISAKLRLAIQALHDTSVEPMPVRVARRLLIMASAYGAWTDRTALTLQVSQEQLAAMLGTSRQTISVILRDLEARGTIRIAYGRIELVELTALKQLAGQRDEDTSTLQASGEGAPRAQTAA